VKNARRARGGAKGRPADLPDAARASDHPGSTNSEESIMNFEVKNGVLTITIDVSKAARDKAVPSSTGKSNVVASTRGFTSIATPDGVVKLSLNATV
jgi:hypothetical protein